MQGLMVNMSHWGGELTLEEAQCLKAEGILGVIVGAGPGNYGSMARQQAQMAARAGLTVDAYTYLEFAGNAAEWVDAAMSSVSGVPVRTWFLDLEDTKNGADWTALQRTDHARRALRRFADHAVFAHIYSSGWFWKPYMDDTATFAREGRKLWHAWYDNDPDIDGMPFGGWTESDVCMEQFVNTETICGQSLQRNALYFVPHAPGNDRVPTQVSADYIREIIREDRAKDRRLLLQLAYAVAGVPRPYKGDAVGEALAKVKAIAEREAPLWSAVQLLNAALRGVMDAVERMEPGLGLDEDERRELANAIDQVSALVRGEESEE